MNDDERAIAFARWFDEQMCSRIERWRWGWLFLDADLPTVADSNFLSIDDPSAGATPDEAVAEAERVHVSAGIGHRKVVVVRPAPRLVSAFERAGWGVERFALMVQRRPPAPLPPLPSAAEVPLAAFHSFRQAFGGSQAPDENARSYEEKIDRRIGTRCFLARMDERAVSGCVAWIHGQDAQIDMVATAPDARGRGAASAVILAATEAARSAGATWIHLYTRADTGPVPLYERVGYDVAGGVTDFVGA